MCIIYSARNKVKRAGILLKEAERNFVVMSNVNVRVMDRDEDYQRMGTKKGVIEPWEDSKRDDDRAGVYEWWYFDMILDDGSKAVIHFNTKDNKTIKKSGTIPSVVLKITSPDGKEYKDNVVLTAADAHFGTSCCDVKFGPHSIYGDFKEYKIHVAPTGGVCGTDGAGGHGAASDVGCDLTLTSLAKPWRPGAGGFAFDDGGYFTWLCAVPRGTVCGDLYYNGEHHTVTGAGYHDHQWGNVAHNKTWYHWIWGRQDFGDYAMLTFDICTQKKFGYTRLPMFFLEDKDGNLLLEQLTTPKCRIVEEYTEKLTGKKYPKEVAYTLTQGKRKLVYTIRQQEELESRDAGAQMPKALLKVLELKDLHPSTTRNFAHGKMTYTDESGKTVTREGDMIYEFVYMGMNYRAHMETK